MRDITIDELEAVSGGIWCTWDGQACSGCANMIEIDGNDCSVILSTANVRQGKLDTGGIIMGLCGTLASGTAGFAASYMGLGVAASTGIGLALGVLILTAYATTHLE